MIEALRSEKMKKAKKKNFEPTLTGGILFFLICLAKRTSTKKRNSTFRDREEPADHEIMAGLIQVFDSKYKADAARVSSLKTATSMYKSCKINSSKVLPFTINGNLSSFYDEIKTDYKVVLKRMNLFIDDYIDAEHYGKKLAKYLFVIFEKDSSINDDSEIYIGENGTTVTKQELRNYELPDLSVLLLAIFTYIIFQPTKNKDGGATYKEIALDKMPLDLDELLISQYADLRNKETKHQIHNDLFNNDEPHTVELKDTELENVDNILKGKAFVASNKDIFLPKIYGNSTNIYSDYLSSIKKKYGKVKTLLYTDEALDFDSIYVCNDISQNSKWRGDLGTKFNNPTLFGLIRYSKDIIITATGGMGKSMLLRHLLLQASCDKRIKKVPVLISLRNIEDSGGSVDRLLCESIKTECEINITYEQFTNELKKGTYAFLLDGLDEVSSNLRSSVETTLDNYATVYSNTAFIITSRAYSEFLNMPQYNVMRLNPLTDDQAIKLVEKLEFRPDKPSIKKRFINKLKNKLLQTHKEFTHNPLLLTIMLMTYEQCAEISTDMHVFYEEAFEALARRHDASKGAYKRAFKTNLSVERFEEYLSEFCARTYLDDIYSFTSEEFKRYFNSLKIWKKDDCPFGFVDFISDLVNNVCLMYYENNKYNFIHRSFQEYFCALYFAYSGDKVLENVWPEFEKKHRNNSDEAFSMLCAIVPKRVEDTIFRPFLKNIFTGTNKTENYWNFLEQYHKTASWYTGNLAVWTEVRPQSTVLTQILITLGLNVETELELPDTNETRVTSLYNNPTNIGKPIIEKSELDAISRKTHTDYDLEPGAYYHEIEYSELREKHKEDDDMKSLYDAVESNDFVLKEQYDELRAYYKKLEAKHEAPMGDKESYFE